MASDSDYLPVYIRIQQALEREIQQGRYRSHERLPSIIELSQKFQASDQTVKRALRGMVREGLVYTVNGKGTFVADPCKAAEESAAPETVALVYTRLQRDPFDESFYSAVLRGIEEELTAAGLGLELVMTQRISVDRLIEARKQGALPAAIVASKLPDDQMAEFVRHGRATVSVNIEYPPIDRLYCVANDEFAAACTAVAHLSEVGCRRVGGIMVLDDVSFARLRLRAFSDAFRKYYPGQELAIEFGSFEERTAYVAMRTLLEQYPEIDGVFAANDDMAIGAVLAAAEIGRAVPDDLKVVGYDDVEAARVFRPSLTTLHVDREDLGRKAVRELLRRWASPEGGFQVERIAPRLVRRESTGFASGWGMFSRRGRTAAIENADN